MGAATCQVLKGGIIHLDDVGGAIAFQKIRDKKGKLVDTLAFTNEDEIALDYKLIQDTYGADCYNIYLRQETLKTGGPIGHRSIKVCATGTVNDSAGLLKRTDSVYLINNFVQFFYFGVLLDFLLQS